MSFRIPSVIARLPHAVSARMPSAVRRRHQISDPCAYGHPSTEIFSKYFLDLQIQCKEKGEGLLRSWMIKAEDPTSEVSTSVFAKFMDSLSRDPYFGKAIMTVPKRDQRSSPAFFRYLQDVQEARALLLLAGYSELFNSSPFVRRPDPIAMLPKEVQRKILMGNLRIINQANCLRDWIERYSTGIRVYGTCSITYSNPLLPIGVIPKEIATWPLVQVELDYQAIQDFPVGLMPLIPQLRCLSLLGNPIATIPKELNKLRQDAIIRLSEAPIKQINANVCHPALHRCEGIRLAAIRLDVREHA